MRSSIRTYKCVECFRRFTTHADLQGDQRVCVTCRVEAYKPPPPPVRPPVLPTTGTLRRHKITMAQFNTMVRRQNGVCAICWRLPKEWVIDHNHDASRKVRGALCQACNCALGMFGDDPETMRRAIAYLEARGNYANQAARSTVDPTLITDPRFTKRYFSREGA